MRERARGFGIRRLAYELSGGAQPDSKETSSGKGKRNNDVRKPPISRGQPHVTNPADEEAPKVPPEDPGVCTKLEEIDKVLTRRLRESRRRLTREVMQDKYDTPQYQYERRMGECDVSANGSASTIPVRNMASEKRTNSPFSSLIYLSLLPTHNSCRFVDEEEDGRRRPKFHPGDVVVTSLKMAIHAFDSPEVTKPVLSMNSVLNKTDETVHDLAKLCQFREGIQAYETLHHELKKHFAHSNLIRFILGRLAILHLLADDKNNAIRYARKAVEACSTSSKRVFAESLIQLGFIHFGCNQLEKAKAAWREAAYKIGDGAHLAALLWNNLACLQYHEKDYAAAEESLLQSLALQKQSRPVAPSQVTKSLINMSTTLGNTALVAEAFLDYNKAISSLEESLLVQESVLGSSDDVGVYMTSQHLYRVQLAHEEVNHEEERRNELEAPLNSLSLGIFDDDFSLPLPRATTGAIDLTDFLQLGSLRKETSTDQRVRATMLESFQSMPTKEQPLGSPNANQTKRVSIPVDVDRAAVHQPDLHMREIYTQAQDYILHNQVDEAFDLLSGTLRGHRKTYGPVHPTLATTLNNMGMILVYAEKYNAALAYFRQAINVRTATLGANHHDVGASLIKLGLTYMARKDFDRANVTFTHVLHTRRQMVGCNHIQLVRVLNNMACLHYEQGNLLEATRSLENCCDIIVQQARRNDRSAMIAKSIVLNNLGFVLYKRQLYVEATKVIEEGTSIQLRFLDERNPRVVCALDNLATTSLRQTVPKSKIDEFLQNVKRQLSW